MRARRARRHAPRSKMNPDSANFMLYVALLTPMAGDAPRADSRHRAPCRYFSLTGAAHSLQS